MYLRVFVKKTPALLYRISLQWNVCAAHVNNFSSNLVERVDFSDSRVALLWASL